MMDERQTEYELDDEVPVLDDSSVLGDAVLEAELPSVPVPELDDAVLEAERPSVLVPASDDAVLEVELPSVLDLALDVELPSDLELVLKAALSLDLELVLKEERFSVRDQVRDRQVDAGLQGEIQ